MTDIRRFMHIVEGLFTRRRPVEPVSNPLHHQPDSLEIAQQSATAEEYADLMNPIGVFNSDPDDLHDRARRERERLITQWNNWNRLGML